MDVIAWRGVIGNVRPVWCWTSWGKQHQALAPVRACDTCQVAACEMLSTRTCADMVAEAPSVW